MASKTVTRWRSMPRMTKHVSKAGKVDLGDGVMGWCALKLLCIRDCKHGPVTNRRSYQIQYDVDAWTCTRTKLEGRECFRARSIQPKFPEISVQNSMDRFGPTGKVSKKLVHLLRWTTFPGRTGRNFGWMDRALNHLPEPGDYSF